MRSPLHRLVVVLLAVSAATCVALLWAEQAWSSAPRAWIAASAHEQTLLLGVFLLLGFAAEIGYVRVRRGDAEEDLTFAEAALVAGFLVLPPIEIFVISLAGLAMVCFVIKRPLVKTLVNLSSSATAAAAFLVIAMLAVDQAAPFSLASVLGLLLATTAFAAVHLLALSRVLGIVEGVRPVDVVRSEWKLSAFIVVSQVGLGTVAVAVALYAPVLLPFTALPILAIRYAYNAVARHAAEVERSRSLVALGSTLAASQEGQDFLPDAAALLRRLFACDVLSITTPDGQVLEEGAGQLPVVRIQSGWERRLRDVRASLIEPAPLDSTALPAGWRHGVTAALDLAEAGRGLVTLGWLASGAHVGARPWSRNKTPIAAADLALLGAVTASIGTSMRARQHLADLVQESSKMKSVVEHSSDGIVVIDEEGQLLVWSPMMEQITGLADGKLTVTVPPGQDAVAELLSQLIRTSGGVLDADALQAQLDPSRQRTDLTVILGSDEDSSRELKVSVARTHDRTGAWSLAVLTVHDVTRERRLERLKTDFIATVSHELRTPITPIKGYAKLIASKGDAMPAEKRLKALRMIEERADHLGRLVEDLLLTSRVSTSRTAKFVVESSRQDLARLVEQAVESFPQLAGRVTVTGAAAPVPVDGDPVRIVQCLSNLLSNADKYSPADSPVSVELTAALQAGQPCRVSISDRGRGIAPDEQGKVFERFYRIEDALTMRTGGSGLGLFIARELARAMHGDLTVASKIGEGSTFTLELPLADRADEGPDTAGPGVPLAS